MSNEPVAPENPGVANKASWFERFAQAKLSPLIVLGFFAFLALMSAAATGVSYAVHHLARH